MSIEKNKQERMNEKKVILKLCVNLHVFSRLVVIINTPMSIALNTDLFCVPVFFPLHA